MVLAARSQAMDKHMETKAKLVHLTVSKLKGKLNHLLETKDNKTLTTVSGGIVGVIRTTEISITTIADPA